MASVGYIGKCIYCGSTEPPLTDEHTISEGFGGTDYLQAATCETCRAETAKAENALGVSLEPLLRSVGILGKKKKIKKVRVKGRVDRKLFSQDLDPSEIAVLALFPIFSEPPRFMLGNESSENITFETQVFFNPQRLGHCGAAGSFRKASPDQFAKMVAKIAHATAVAELGLGSFEPFLTDFIRGIDERWGYWVGKCPESPEPIPGNKAVSVQIYLQGPPHAGILLGRVRLFELFGGPIYDTPIGRLLTALSEPPKSGLSE